MNINNPSGCAADDAGNVFIADTFNSRVRMVNITTGYMYTVAGTGTAGSSGDGGPATMATLKDPQNLIFDNSGNWYISDPGANNIRKVNATTGIISTIAGNGSAGYGGDGGPATLASLNPYGLSFDAAGQLYVADYGNNRVRKINTSGFIVTVAGSGNGLENGDGAQATNADLLHPYGVTIGLDGNLYVADITANTIRKVLL